MTNNITEKNTAEIPLNQIVQYLPLATAMFDTNMCYLHVNENWITDHKLQHEYDTETILGKSHYAVFPEIEDDWKALHQRCLQGEIHHEERKPFLRKDGTLDWLRGDVHPWYTNDGEIGGLIMYIDVITHIIEQDETLRKSEERLRAAQRLAQIGHWDIDLKTNEQVLSDESFRILGMEPSPDPIPSELFTRMVHPDDLPILYKQREHSIETGGIVSTDYRVIMADGSIRYLHAESQIHFDDDGTPVMESGVTQDITTRRQEQEALRKSEERYKIVSELISDYAMSQIVHPDGTLEIEWTTPSIESILGYSINELTPYANNYGLVYPADVDRLKSDFQKIIQGEFITGEYRFIRKDGDIRWVQIHRHPIWDKKEQRVVRYYSVGQDITNEKQTETAIQNLLKEKQHEAEKYHNLFEQSLDAIFLVSPGGYYLDCNSSATEMFGYTLDEIKKLRPFDLIDEREIKPSQKVLASLLQGEVIQPYERLARKKNGELFPIEVSVAAIRLTNNDILYFHAIIRDLTQRKRIEESLRQSKERYRIISEMISDYAFYTSFEDVGKLEWQLGDPHVIWEYPYDETSNFNELNHPEDTGLLKADIKAVKSGKSTTSEFRIITKDGSIKWMHMRRRPVWNSDKTRVIGYYGVGQDITQRKDALKLLENLVSQLEEKNIELERFTYAVSHDLKSPLITIQTFLDLLKQDLENDDAERVEKDLAFMQDAAAQMEQLLDGLLRLSRITRLADPSEKIDLTELIPAAVTMVMGRIKARGVEVVLDIPDNAPIVQGDWIRLLEVFQNLIDNAVKYMGDQTAPKITIRILVENDRVICCVEDNAVSIDPHYHDQIFGLFEKLNPESEGTGIGLALVKRLVELHHGQIWVESLGIGYGNSFYFSLPILI